MNWKKIFSALLLAAAVLSFSACSAVEKDSLPDDAGSAPLSGSHESTGGDFAADSSGDSVVETEDSSMEADHVASSNILIAYFTWAENTYVENPDSVDTDATTSASVLPPGNAAKIAGWIQEETGGDLFSIVVTEPYSSDYDECLDRAADEKAERARPQLLYHVDNMEDYDIVFLGFPNWWYTVPMAVHSFLEEYDFSGKTVVPFVTHGTGGLSNTVSDVTAALSDSATVLEPIGVYRPEVDGSRPKVQEWLGSLGLEIKEQAQRGMLQMHSRQWKNG